MKKLIKFALLIVLTLSLFISGCAGEDKKPEEGNNVAKKDETITFGVTPWTSTVPPTQVARLIIEDMGYNVELEEADVGIVYTGLAEGAIDVFMDAWLPVMHKNYIDKYGDKIDDTSVSYPNGELGWVIPTYVEDIRSIEDLKGNEDKFGNKIYGIGEGAGMTTTSREMIEDYGLDLEYAPSSETGMLGQAQKDIDDGNPVLFLGWRPHPMFVNFDLKVLEDPKGYFKTSEVHVLTYKDFKNKAPDVYKFLQKWSIPVGDIEKMIIKIDEGNDPAEVAQEWIDNNQDKVNKMLEK
ncbi:MAG: glycine betaine ABC transporter substrate-binding protein [Firmicutes bacterium]|nr:glycine betaine ABC transporter substrate-binding protein [Bacillota bacterium]